MKTLLPLLLLFVSSVVSQEDSFYCTAERCPKGYIRSLSGRNILNHICLCTKRKPEDPCFDLFAICVTFGDDCPSLASKCTPQELLKKCEKVPFLNAEMCANAAKKIRQNN